VQYRLACDGQSGTQGGPKAERPRNQYAQQDPEDRTTDERRRLTEYCRYKGDRDCDGKSRSDAVDR
jgi:hypothetical protein